MNVSLPRPLSARLDALVELATAAGENTSRKETVAALILGAPESDVALVKQLRIYRTATRSDAAVQGFDEADFIEPESRDPGPRRRRMS